MITDLFRCYGVRIHTDDIDPAESVGAITAFGVPDEVDVTREALDGNIFPSITALTSHNERIDFTTLNVNTLLDIVGTVGLCAQGDTTQTGIELFLSRISKCTPGPDVGAVNMRISAVSTAVSPASAVFGILTPGQLTANHGANATMSAIFTPQGVAGNAGLAVATGVALPAIADTKSRFRLSESFSINGVSIVGKKGLSINFNPQLLRESADGNLAPDWVSLETLFAMINITGINPTWAAAANIPRSGKVFAHANCTFWLRQMKPDSTTGFWDNVDAKHIKITCAGKAFVTNLASGQANRPVESGIVMYAEFDGTNAPVVINTDQAIV